MNRGITHLIGLEFKVKTSDILNYVKKEEKNNV